MTLAGGPRKSRRGGTQPYTPIAMEKTADYVKRWVAALESKDLDRVLASTSTTSSSIPRWLRG
jgi:hypothetical protein